MGERGTEPTGDDRRSLDRLRPDIDHAEQNVLSFKQFDDADIDLRGCSP
jgi:hypothetical protein